VLVVHSRGERMKTFDEARYLASHVRGARLVALESRNHIVLEHEAAWPEFLREVCDFLVADRAPGSPGADVSTLLSPRELDVLGLAAEGADNDAIAARLHLSLRTVERHLQNVYAKLGLHGRNARAAAVARLLTRA